MSEPVHLAVSWKKRLEKESYVRWIKVAYGLHLLNDGIRSYIEKESRAFHGALLAKKMVPCTCAHAAGRRPNQWHDISNCAWANELQGHHTKKKPSWGQSDGSKWTDPNVGYWEVAKLYMPNGSGRGKTCADETDATGLLNIIQFCDYYKINTMHVEAVKNCRNELCHAPQQELTVSQANDAFSSMKKLLLDVELQSDSVAQEALAKIIDLEKETLVEHKDIDEIIQLVNDDLSDMKGMMAQEFDFLKDQGHKLFQSVNEGMNEIKKSLRTDLKGNEMNEVDFRDNNTENGVWKYFKSFSTSLKYFDRRHLLLLFLIHVVVQIFLVSLLWYNWIPAKKIDNADCIVPHNYNFLGLKQFDFIETMEQASKDFIGRKWMFQELSKIIANSNNPHSGFLIIATPGFGKTAFVSSLICSGKSNYSIIQQIIGYHFCINSYKTTRNGGQFVQNLANMISFQISEYREQLSNNAFIQNKLKTDCFSDPSGCFEQAILSPLITISKLKHFSAPMYIVVDALDECHDEPVNDMSIMNIIRSNSKRFPKWLRIIATTRNVSTIRRQLADYQQLEFFQDDARNLQDIQDFLLKPGKFHIHASDTNMIEMRTNQSQGNFLFLKCISQLVNSTTSNKEWKIRPGSLNSLYQEIFERKFKTAESFLATQKVCEVLVATIEPLTAEEVYEILHFENNKFHYYYDFMKIQDILSDLLLYSSGKSYMVFFHNTLKEWLTGDKNIGGTFFVDQQNGHKLLASFYLTKLEQKPEIVTPYFIHNLAEYIVKADRIDLRNIFLNINSSLITVSDNQTRMTALHLAARNHDSSIVALLLKKFKNPDCTDVNGKTAMYYAVLSGHVESVQILYKSGSSIQFVNQNERRTFINQCVSVYQCEIQKCGFNLLHYASQKGNTDVIKYLVKNGLDISSLNGVNDSAIHIAAKLGHSETVKALIENGVKPDDKCLNYAVSEGQYETCKVILDSGFVDQCKTCSTSFDKHQNDFEHLCNSALHTAAIHGFYKIAELLLSKKENALNCANRYGRFPIHEAVKNNRYEVVESLLKVKDNPSHVCVFQSGLMTNQLAQEEEDEMCPCDFTPLHIAAYYGHGSITELLVQNKARHDMTDCDEMEPIHIAACQGHENVLRILVKNGVDVNRKTFEGMTALHFACKCKKEKLFKVLNNLGADGFEATVDNKLPFYFLLPNYKKEQFTFIDSYVEHPIEPIDFKSVLKGSVKDSQWHTLWTEYLIAFDEGINNYDFLDLIQGFLEMNNNIYKSVISSQIPQKIFGSQWHKYKFLTKITRHNYYFDFLYSLKMLQQLSGPKWYLITPIKWAESYIRENSTGCSRLMKAITYNQVYKTDVLIQSLKININCKSSGFTPLLKYLNTGGPHMAKVLVKFRPSVDIKCDQRFEESVFHLAAYHKLHYIQYLTVFQDHDKWEQYLETEIAIFDYLFDEYENVTIKGKSRIQRVRDGPVIKAIKHYPSGKNIIDECLDEDGFTALHRAAQGANVVAVKHFLAMGANVSIKVPNSEFSPLVLAIWYAIKYRPHNNFHQPSILTSLEIDFASLTANVILDDLIKSKPFDVGCDKNKVNPTILHLAATRGMWRFIKKLFTEKDQKKVIGLDVNCPTLHGITPMYLAKVYGAGDCYVQNPWCKVVEVLRYHGGSDDILPDQTTEYFVILNFLFQTLPNNFNLKLSSDEVDVLKKADPTLSENNILESMKSIDVIYKKYHFLGLHLTTYKHLLFYYQYKTFLIFIRATLYSQFLLFTAFGGMEYSCVSMKTKMIDDKRHNKAFTKPIEVLQPAKSKEILVKSIDKTKKIEEKFEEISQYLFMNDEPNSHTEETILYPPLIHILTENLDMCKLVFKEKLDSFEETLTLNFQSYKSNYKKLRNVVDRMKKEYQDQQIIRKYEEIANALLAKSIYGHANVTILLKTIRFWRNEIRKMPAFPSISTYIAKKLNTLVGYDTEDEEKMRKFILDLAQNGSKDYKYLRMLWFSKAPMFDKTMAND